MATNRQGVSTGATYARRRQSTTWSKSATKQRPRNGTFTALEPRAANGSKNSLAKDDIAVGRVAERQSAQSPIRAPIPVFPGDAQEVLQIDPLIDTGNEELVAFSFAQQSDAAG